MRKLITYSLMLFILLLSFSCKKDHTCNCKVRVTTESQAGNPNYGTTNSVVITMKNVTKKIAKSNCVTLAAKYSNSSDYIIEECTLQN